jgi:serine/threonine protein kinase
MEYCERGALFSILADKSIELPWVLRRSIMLGLAQGIHYLHTRHPVIIHRDLKSLNVLLTEDWTTKVTDFGLSRYSPQSVSEQMTGQIGTYHWMAPEVINSNHYTEKADVYSYGIILWEILTRHTPYEGMQPVQVVAAVINRNQRPVIPPGTNPGLQALIEVWMMFVSQ